MEFSVHLKFHQSSISDFMPNYLKYLFVYSTYSRLFTLDFDNESTTQNKR